MSIHWPASPDLNLIAAWVGILLGFVSGLMLGLFFRREEWLGGYASFKRRLYRLGHISFFGLGVVNLLFYLTVRDRTFSHWLPWASLAFLVGALAMPICCVLLAHFPKLHLLFAIPVVSLLCAATLTLITLLQPNFERRPLTSKIRSSAPEITEVATPAIGMP